MQVSNTGFYLWKGSVSVSSQLQLKLTPEQIREMPMVDIAFHVLKATNSSLYYRDLMQEVAKIKGYTEEEISEVIAQLYTEINIDGRFACVGNNVWGLKRWYAFDKSDEAMSSGTARPRIINDDTDDEDEDDEIFDEEAESEELDDEFSEDDEEYDEDEEPDDDYNEDIDEELDDDEEEEDDDSFDSDEDDL